MNEHASPSVDVPVVIKYGGNALPAPGQPDPVLAEVAELFRAGTSVVLVHGGGPEIDQRLAERGIATQRVDGMRVTPADALEVTEAVLCGTLNKRIVRACAALGLPAVGISGQDGGTLVAKELFITQRGDLGFVGEIAACDPTLIHALLEGGFLPIVAPVAIADDAAHAYNVNADLAAAAIAGALRASAFVIVTNVARVLRDPDDPASRIDHLTLAEARAFVASDGCQSSMIPKMQAAITAVATGTHAAYICQAKPNTIRAALQDNDATIVSEGH